MAVSHRIRSTEVRAGWWETATGPVIYVIMLRESTGNTAPSSAQRLRKTVDTLTAKVVDAGLAPLVPAFK